MSHIQELEGDGSLNAVFVSIPISSFHPPACGRVVEIPSSATIAEAVEILAQARIIAAPCRDVDAPVDVPYTQ